MSEFTFSIVSKPHYRCFFVNFQVLPHPHHPIDLIEIEKVKSEKSGREREGERGTRIGFDAAFAFVFVYCLY